MFCTLVTTVTTISDNYNVSDYYHHHQLTLALGFQVVPFRSHSGWCLAISLPLDSFAICSLFDFFVISDHFSVSSFQPPLSHNATPCKQWPLCQPGSVFHMLFLFSPLSLLIKPSQTLEIRDNGRCPALRCPVQGQMIGHNKHLLRRQCRRERGRELLSLRSSMVWKNACSCSFNQTSFCFRRVFLPLLCKDHWL